MIMIAKINAHKDINPKINSKNACNKKVIIYIHVSVINCNLLQKIKKSSIKQ